VITVAVRTEATLSLFRSMFSGNQGVISMTVRRIRFLAKFLKRIRRLMSIMLFVIYIALAIGHLSKVENPRAMGGLYIAAGIAHLAS
jgi:uncharacterized membrane protein